MLLRGSCLLDVGVAARCCSLTLGASSLCACSPSPSPSLLAPRYKLLFQALAHAYAQPRCVCVSHWNAAAAQAHCCHTVAWLISITLKSSLAAAPRQPSVLLRKRWRPLRRQMRRREPTVVLLPAPQPLPPPQSQLATLWRSSLWQLALTRPAKTSPWPSPHQPTCRRPAALALAAQARCGDVGRGLCLLGARRAWESRL